MTIDAVAAGMTPYRPSPPPSPAPSWRTPSCAEDLASCFGVASSSPAALPLPAVGGGVADGAEEAAVGEPFLAERHPGGWTCVRERWSSDAGRDQVLSRYLTDGERTAYEHLSAAVQPSWLLGRVAAKDAVRWWLADRGTVVEPTEVPLANEPSGRPVIDAGSSRSARAWEAIDLRISIAHVTGTGVAIVAQGNDVGIDLEEAAPRPDSFARVAFSRKERADRVQRTRPGPVPCAPVLLPSPAGLLPSPAADCRSGLLPSPAADCRSGLLPSPAADPHTAMDEATWMAAAWCAKEAAGKAAGTGLQGRPTRFVTRLVGPDLFTVGERLVRCHRLDPANYCSDAGHSLVVGWTLSVDRDVELMLDGDAEPAWARPGGLGALLVAGARG